MINRIFQYSIICVFSFCGVCHAEHAWFPYPVEIWDSPFDMASTRSSVDYVPVKKTKNNWNICVSFPHMKDTYWLAVNFGISQEIKRLGCSMQLYQAGGYENLDTQIVQIKQCVKDGADGVIVGAISYNGLDGLIQELKHQDIPVIDVINGVSTDAISAKSLVSFREMGEKAGEYIVSLHQNEKDRIVRVAWFPGPEGAGWVSAGNQGFIDAIEGSNLEIVATKYGDTGTTAQGKLINTVLDEYPDELDYIVGTGVTAEAAVKILRNRGVNKRIKVMSYYLTSGVYRKILRGNIIASPTDSTVIQGRVAVDQLIRILDHKPYYKHVGPKLYVLDIENIRKFKRKTLLAPTGFKATYSVYRQILP